MGSLGIQAGSDSEVADYNVHIEASMGGRKAKVT
jgi:hypothetical protein